MGTKTAWTPERRARQAEIIQRIRPWEHSTGPRTEAGKRISSQNARITSLSAMRPLRAVRYALRGFAVLQRRFLGLAIQMKGGPIDAFKDGALFSDPSAEQVWEIAKLAREIEDAKAVIFSLFPNDQEELDADLRAFRAMLAQEREDAATGSKKERNEV